MVEAIKKARRGLRGRDPKEAKGAAWPLQGRGGRQELRDLTLRSEAAARNIAATLAELPSKMERAVNPTKGQHVWILQVQGLPGSQTLNVRLKCQKCESHYPFLRFPAVYPGECSK